MSKEVRSWIRVVRNRVGQICIYLTTLELNRTIFTEHYSVMAFSFSPILRHVLGQDLFALKASDQEVIRFL